MKLSNFELEKTEGDSLENRKYFALVDVTTGFLFWKKTSRVQIFRKYAGYWFFVSTGEYTPEYQAERLARSWAARTGQEA